MPGKVAGGDRGTDLLSQAPCQKRRGWHRTQVHREYNEQPGIYVAAQRGGGVVKVRSACWGAKFPTERTFPHTIGGTISHWMTEV